MPVSVSILVAAASRYFASVLNYENGERAIENCAVDKRGRGTNWTYLSNGLSDAPNIYRSHSRSSKHWGEQEEIARADDGDVVSFCVNAFQEGRGSPTSTKYNDLLF